MYQQRINHLEKNLPRISPILALRAHIGGFDSAEVKLSSWYLSSIIEDIEFCFSSISHLIASNGAI